MLAYDYPLLGVFWTLLEFFLLFLWIWLLIIVFADIFRSSDLSGLGKALWVLFVIVVPLVGVLVYLGTRGGRLSRRGSGGASTGAPIPAGGYPYGTWR